ncbi:MAG: CoA-transferase, partial [Marmoricola sp.]
IHRIVSNLGVFDVKGEGDTVRLLSVHPGVTVDEVVAATGFPLAVGDDVAVTRDPTETELMIIRNVLDPKNLRDREVPPVDAGATT